MLTTISYSESDIVALREMAELQYHTAYNKVVNETVTVDENTYNFDEIFMENCIYAGYNMNEAIDAAMQKHKLLNSQEMKLVKRLAKQTRDFVKKGDYESAIPLAKKRLAHLENMVRRAENIDDDEQFIITAETMVKSYLYTIIATHVLGFIINGLLPGSGPLVTAIKKGIDAFKLTNLKAGLAGKSFGAAVTFIAGKFLTISGAAKLTGSYIAARKQRKWKKTRAGDVNREVNEGRPDTTHLSISRTQAKVKLKKLIQAQKEEIKILEDSAKIQAQKAKADNKLATVAEAADPESARLRRDVQVALNIKNGKSTKAVPNPFAVAAVDCPADKFEQYLKNAAKPNPKPFSIYLDKMNDEVKAKNAKAVTLIKSSMNHPVVFFHDSFEGALEFYDVTTGKIVNLSYDSGKVHIDGPYNVAAYLKMHANAQDPDRAKYQQIAKTLSESAEVLDEGLLKKFGGYIKAEQEKERARLEKERAKHADEYDAAYQKQRLANRKATDRERREVKNAEAIKNGNYSVELPPFSALAAAGVPISDVEAYLSKNAKKQPEEIKTFLTDLDLNLEYADLDEETSKIAAENQKKVTRELNRHLNDDIYVIFSSKYTIQMYCAKERSVYVAYADINAGRYPGDGISVDKYNSLKDYLMQDRYSGYSNMKSDDVAFYKRLLKSSVNESIEVLDEGIFGASKYAKHFAGLLKTAQAVKNGTANGQVPSLEALSYIKCDPKIIENYFRKIAKKDPKIFDDFMSYVSNELDEDDERISVLNRKLVPHKNNPIVNLHANHPVKNEIFFYDASDNMIYQVSEDDDFDFNRISVSAQLKESYPDIVEKDYKKAMKIAGIKESAEILDEKFFGKRKADTGKKPPEKKVNNAPVNVQELNRAKQEIQVALNLKNGKSVSSIPDLHVIAFVNCPPDVLEKYMQDNASKNSKIIENQIDDMIDYVDRYSSGRGIKDSDPKKYEEMQKDCKDAEERLRKMVNHKLFFFDTDADPETPLCFYDADTRKWVESSYLDGEAYVTEESVAGMLKKQEKRLRSTYMQSKVSLYQKALQNMKGELSESVTLNEAKLKAAERNELPDSAFGIPSKRKFPLNDPAHVKAAVKMFRHASPADRPELARRIKRAIKKFNLDIEIGEDNPLHEYK